MAVLVLCVVPLPGLGWQESGGDGKELGRVEEFEQKLNATVSLEAAQAKAKAQAQVPPALRLTETLTDPDRREGGGVVL